MNDVVLGLLAIAVGALFCFRGYLTMRVIIPVWGAFAGFWIGVGLVSRATGDDVLSNVGAWIIGLLGALAFGFIAYAYYEVSIVIGMGAIGFALGASLMVTFDVSWTWLIVLGGVAVAMLLAFLAIVGELPMVVLTVLSALAGSSAMVSGVMLLAGRLQSSELNEPDIVTAADSAPWWVLYVVLAAAGMVVQLRTLDEMRSTLRAQWSESGGRLLRSP